MNHTPGPWAVLEHERTDRAYPIYEANDPTIVPIGWVGTKKRPNLANARLMAAAPELLTACEAAYRILFKGTENTSDEEWSEAFGLAETAIAKAVKPNA